MRKILGVIIAIVGIGLGLYVGGWLMFIKPIIACCMAFDAGTLTGTMVGWTVIKCIFASFIGSIIGHVGIVIGAAVID